MLQSVRASQKASEAALETSEAALETMPESSAERSSGILPLDERTSCSLWGLGKRIW
jgi:hypothetical protein